MHLLYVRAAFLHNAITRAQCINHNAKLKERETERKILILIVTE